MSVQLYKAKFNGYEYVSGVDYPATFSEEQGARMQVASTPGRYGQYTAGGVLGARKFSIKGMLVASDPSDPESIRAAWDNLKVVHIPGVPAQFFVDDNWFINAEVSGVVESVWDGLAHRAFEIQFVASDPFWYLAETFEAVTSSAALAGGVQIVTTGTAGTNGATAGAEPVWSIGASIAGATEPPYTITIANATTGETMVITMAAPWFIGADVLFTIDTRKASEGVGESSGQPFLWTGQMPRLANGANEIVVTAGANVTIGDSSVSWADRKY